MDASSAFARSIAATTFFASSSLPSTAPSAPWRPPSLSVEVRRLPRLACRLPPGPVICSMFSSVLLSVATMRGISSWMSPRSTGRSAPSGSGGACRVPPETRVRAPPPLPRPPGERPRALGPVGQRRVLQVAAESPDTRPADDAALQGEDARDAQPSRILLWHLQLDARAAVIGERNAHHPPDGKAGEGEIHAEAHALGIVGHQREALSSLERAARVQRVENEPGGDHDGEAE